MTVRQLLLIVCILGVAGCEPEAVPAPPPWLGHAALAELNELPRLSSRNKYRYLKDRLAEGKLVVQDGRVTTTEPLTNPAGLDALELTVAQHAFAKATGHVVVEDGAGVLVFATAEHFMVYLSNPSALKIEEDGDSRYTIHVLKDSGALAWVWHGAPMWREPSPLPLPAKAQNGNSPGN